jgi:ATP-dependent RNA helicase HelY
MTAADYLAGLPYDPDPFQAAAAAAVDRGEAVVVTAPTGAGKTVVAEAAIARALAGGKRAVYTTPLKALSNQKYTDFRRSHGERGVGLLTGDNSINGGAPIVVMTTEVLRNMMYASSPDLETVGTVILDEVHYLADRARGSVWEEIIVHLDRRIPLICLSATIANPEEFAGWVERRRGPTALVVETTRPVPLDPEYLVKDRWKGGSLHLMELFDRRGRPNREVDRLLRTGRGRRHATPRRFETVELLRGRSLLPAIYFIFSRAGCDAASFQVVDFGLRLTDPEEAAVIREVAEERTAHLSDRDLGVLGYGRWLWALEAGVAAHHAGLVPAFKETVEHLFAAGLVRLVFATETLSLGINMPARTVVLESLSKFTGESHELLQPGDFTQLTGRAGRRGIDRRGTAVVLHSPYVPFDRVAAIAAAGAHPLRSSFAPTYNMAANLIARYERPLAEELLNASFAEFREERERAHLAAELDAARRRLDLERTRAACPAGLTETAAARSHGTVMAEFAASTSAGDVLEWRGPAGMERRVLVARGSGTRPRMLTVDERGHLDRLAPERLPADAARVGRLDLPEPFLPRDEGYRLGLAEALAAFEPGERRTAFAGPESAGPACPDHDRHVAAERAARRLERRIERIERRLRGRPGGLVPQFRAIVGVLEEMGYADGWRLTESGERLRFIYNELDLLLSEALGHRLLDGLDAAETAAFVSAFTYEPRADGGDGGWPTALLEERAAALEDLWAELASVEAGARLPETRPPEAGFAETAYRWAAGADLEALFEEETTSVGDFVRNCRQLIDLLRQVRDVAPGLAGRAEEAVRAVDRGVVAAAGAV